MILWIVVFVVAGTAAGVAFSVMCTRFHERHVRLTLGIPVGLEGDVGQLRARLAAQSVADTEMKINAAAPALKPQHRRRLALALARQRGLLPRKVA
jgi:hypothetical protein